MLDITEKLKMTFLKLKTQNLHTGSQRNYCNKNFLVKLTNVSKSFTHSIKGKMSDCIFSSGKINNVSLLVLFPKSNCGFLKKFMTNPEFPSIPLPTSLFVAGGGGGGSGSFSVEGNNVLTVSLSLFMGLLGTSFFKPVMTLVITELPLLLVALVRPGTRLLIFSLNFLIVPLRTSLPFLKEFSDEY